jgi:hypothetical protein
MASSCGPFSNWHSATPTCHMTLFFTLSWEIVTTLDYEWNVIRGRRPYRWTIWVCNHSPFSACSVTLLCETDCCVVVALLSYPCGHPRGCRYECIHPSVNDPSQLRGVCHVICLRPYAHFLTARFPKVTIDLQFVRTQTDQIFRGQSSYPRSITFSLDLGLPSPRFLFIVDRASHVRLLLKLPFARFMKFTRIAIWNRNKIIVGIATGVWLTTIAFLIQGEFISLSGEDSPVQMQCGIRCFASE